MSWHIPEPMVQAYVEGDVQGARAASIEAHVMTCENCRASVSAAAPRSRLATIWHEVEEQVDAPPTSWVERLLTAIRLSDTDARLVAAAPSLHASWFSALVAVLAFAVWAGNSGGRGLVVFLLLAPLVPVGAVAGAYGPWIDPTYEVTIASAYPTLRLVLLRSSAVVVASGFVAVLASTLVPDAQVAAAWMLPCLALVALTLALARWVALPVAAVVVAGCYALPLLGALYADADADALEVVLSPSLQWAAAAVAGSALVFMTADPQLRATLRRNR